MDEIIIRPAASDDQQVVNSLARRLAAFELPPWRSADEIAVADGRAMAASMAAGNQDDQVFLAERAGSVVGCLHMLAPVDFFGRRHAHISVLATTERAEGSGVGRALMAHAEDWARTRGLSLLTLNVFAANSRARRFYETAGFAPETLKYAKQVGGE